MALIMRVIMINIIMMVTVLIIFDSTCQSPFGMCLKANFEVLWQVAPLQNCDFLLSDLAPLNTKN